MTTTEPNDYIANVLGRPRKELVYIGKKKDDATSDDGGVNSITRDNLANETERLFQLVAELSDCKAVIDDCTPINHRRADKTGRR